jgi:hypothetical protein
MEPSLESLQKEYESLKEEFRVFCIGGARSEEREKLREKLQHLGRII